jgi:hypothetical protein
VEWAERESIVDVAAQFGADIWKALRLRTVRGDELAVDASWRVRHLDPLPHLVTDEGWVNHWERPDGSVFMSLRAWVVLERSDMSPRKRK